MGSEPELSGIEIDDEGYLVNPDDWTEAIAQEFARRAEITLTPEHWDAIRFMRRWLEEKQVAPDARHVIRFLTKEHGADRNRLFQLFPYGYVEQACKTPE